MDCRTIGMNMKGFATMVEKTSGSLMLNSDGMMVARPRVLFFLDLEKSM